MVAWAHKTWNNSQPDDVSYGLVAYLCELAGGTPPTRIFKDNNGKDIVFDGVENSDFILGKGPSNRDHFFYVTDLAFGGLRVNNFKLLYTAKDTWLGPNLFKSGFSSSLQSLVGSR